MLTQCKQKVHEYFEKNMKAEKENTSNLNDNWFDLSVELGGPFFIGFVLLGLLSVAFFWIPLFLWAKIVKS